MYQAKSGVKNFSLYWGAVPWQNFFSSLNMYQAKSGVKNFSLYWGAVPWQNFFSSLNMYQAKSGVKNFSPYSGGGGGGPLTKIFFLVWTCIKPNLVSTIFPFTGGEGVPGQKIFFPAWTCIKPNLSGVKKFSLYWDRVPPPPPNRHTPVKT